MEVRVNGQVVKIRRAITAFAGVIMNVHPVATRVGREPFRVAAIPVIAITGWWAVSLTIWAVGYPIPYVRVNLVPVLLLVGVCILAATAAFLAVARALPGDVVESPPLRRLPVPVLIGLGAMLALLVPWAEFYSGYHLWQIGSALTDQGGAFAAAAERVTEGTTSRLGIVIVQTVLAPFTLTVVPVTALAWFERRRHAIPLLLGVSALGVMSLLVGRSYYVITAAVLVIAAWAVSRVRRRMVPSWRMASFFVFSPLLFVIAFSASKRSRGGSLVPLCPPGVSECVGTHPPTLWESLSTYVASYASQSMEGLGRAMEGGWAFGGGYRHSPALTGIADSLGFPHTRVVTDQLASHGWSDSANWSTGWAWMANDVPWLVVPIVVAVLAAFLGMFWRRAVRDADWLSVTLFSHGWLALFFMAQNNMLTGDGPAYLGFLVLCGIFVGREFLRLKRRADSNSGTRLAAEIDDEAYEVDGL